LHNVVKHAHAQQAWVDLDLEGPEVRMAIRDDGRGFDTSKLKQDGGSHIGTSTMRERSEAIGAKLELKSYPGGGTEVFVRLPVREVGFMSEEVDAEVAQPQRERTSEEDPAERLAQRGASEPRGLN
jgi:signal transduction histidine kinase